MSTSKKNKKIFAQRLEEAKEKNKGKNENNIDCFSVYPQSSLLGKISVRNSLFLKQPDYQNTSFALSNNYVGLKMINRLMELPCQINVPFLKYVIDNLHCLVEIGILPVLDIKNSRNIEENRR